jgi:gamma-D-glutamyl-L-lysine dipeptidyl-peptidase
MMNNRGSAWIFALALLFWGCTGGPERTIVTGLLQEASQQLAPDRRTQVFDVQGELRGKTLVIRGEIHSQELKEQLIRFLKAKRDYVIVDSLVVLPASDLGGRIYGLATQSVINMRAKPDHAAELGSQALLGTPLKVLKREHSWYYVQTPDDYLGWVNDGLQLLDAGEFQRWTGRPKAIVTAEFGFSRHTPEPGSPVVSDVVAGDILALRSNARAAYEVEYPDGRVAFLSKEIAEPYERWLAAANDTPERIIATAKRFIGIPYFWGGASCKALDCSGFTKTVYFLNGVLLPRDASQQALVGRPLTVEKDFAALQKGDLLFFGMRATAERKERVTHVAIALGGGKFIQEDGDVRINSLDENDPEYSANRRETFLSARRIIGAGEEFGVRRLHQLSYYKSHERQ